ncbi:MAG: putative ABC transporter permease protein [Anaerolineales bacterium]|nr:putative ABC transporter permease protein [Anaerolineales bacterium]
MKQLFAVAINDLRVEFSDRGTWMSFLILPLIFTAVIGVATGGMGGDPNADQRYPVALVDHDGGELAAQFAGALAQSKVVRSEARDEAAALKLLDDKKIRAVVVIPSGFSADLLAGKGVEVEVRASAEDNEGLAVREAVQSASALVSRALLAALVSVEEAEAIRPFADDAERQAYFQEALKLAKDEAESAPAEVANTQASGSWIANIPQGYSQSSPGQLVTWVLATLLAGAAALAAERTMGTLRRLLTMPAPKWTILGGKILGRFTLGIIQMAVMVVAGMLVFKVKWGDSPLALAMIAVSFGLAATALGLFLSTLARTEQQAGGFGTLGTFLLAPLGGAWIPMEITPPAFQTLAQIFPTTWAMRGFTDVIVRGQGPEGVLLETLVLLGFAVIFFALGVWRFKYE